MTQRPHDLDRDVNDFAAKGLRRSAQHSTPWLLSGFTIACLCAPAWAQVTPPSGQAHKPSAAKAKPSTQKVDKPIDETQSAAEALRIILGLKPHEPTPEDKERKLDQPKVQDPEAPASSKATPQDKKQKPETQEKGKQATKSKPIDETKSAGEALKLLMPNAKPVEKPPDLRMDVPNRPAPQEPIVRDAPLDEAELIAQRLRAVASPVPSHFTPLIDGDTIPVHGTVTLYYRNRSTPEISDADLRGLLALEIGDPNRHPVTANFLVRGFSDLDAGATSSFFDDLDDSLDRNFNVYEASIDFNKVESLSILRLGRQTIDETPELAWFDGIRADTEELTDWGLWFGGYAGVPTHLYESSSSGDFIGGLVTGMRPWNRGRVRIDWMHVEDRWNSIDYENDLVGIAFWQGLGDHSQVHASHTWMDGHAKDLTLRGSTFIPEWEVFAQASYRELLSTQKASTTEFDPFSASAFEYQPYRQISTLVSKTVGEHLNLSGGLDLRRLKSGNGEGQFNREFERYFASATLQDAADSTVALTFLGESWNSGGEDITTYGGDLTTRFNPDWTASLGSSYYMYKFDSNTQREHDHVRVYSGKIDYRYSEYLRINGRYEFEKNDLFEVQTFRIGMTWTF